MKKKVLKIEGSDHQTWQFCLGHYRCRNVEGKDTSRLHDSTTFPWIGVGNEFTLEDRTIVNGSEVTKE